MCWDTQWCKVQEDCLRLWAVVVWLAGREGRRFLHVSDFDLGFDVRGAFEHPNLL